jgi:Glycosyltransferase 61
VDGIEFEDLVIKNWESLPGSEPIKYDGQVYLFPLFLPYGHTLMDVYAQYKILKLKYPDLKPVFFEDSSRGFLAVHNNISKDIMTILNATEIIDISKNNYVFEELIAFFDVSDTLPIRRYVPFCDCYMGTEKCGTSEWFKYNYLAIDIIRKDLEQYIIPRKFRNIFISRERYNQAYLERINEVRSQQRYYKDEKELEDFFRSEGYEIVYAEDYGLIDQIKLFSEAKTIASVSGAGLFNLLWGNENTKVIEIMTNPLYRYHFKEFGEHVGVNYIQVDSRHDSIQETIAKLKGPV